MSTENTAAQPIESHKPSTGDSHQLAASQRFSEESNSRSSTNPENDSVSSAEKDAVKSDASQGFLDFSRNDPLQGDKQSNPSATQATDGNPSGQADGKNPGEGGEGESKPGAPKNPGEGKNPVEGKDGEGKNPAERPPQQAPGGPVEGQTPGDKLPPPQAPGAPLEGTQGVTVQPRDGVTNPGMGNDDGSKEAGTPKDPGDSKQPIKDPGEAKNPPPGQAPGNPGGGGGTQSQGAERATLPQAPGAPLEGGQGTGGNSEKPTTSETPGAEKPNPGSDNGRGNEHDAGTTGRNLEKQQPKDGQAPGSRVEASDQIATPGTQANQQGSATAQRDASPFSRNR